MCGGPADGDEDRPSKGTAKPRRIDLLRSGNEAAIPVTSDERSKTEGGWGGFFPENGAKLWEPNCPQPRGGLGNLAKAILIKLEGLYSGAGEEDAQLR